MRFAPYDEFEVLFLMGRMSFEGEPSLSASGGDFSGHGKVSNLPQVER